jgi:hypothetical protein
MANIALTSKASADRRVSIVVSIQQQDMEAAEAITEGAPVRIDTAGKATNANGTTTTENRIWGIAINRAAAGEAVTVLRRGILDGYDFSQAYDAAIYLSDTDGRLGDTAGTVSTVVGRVVPGTATTRGTAYDKLLSVEL